jgi:hypothetical protein
MAVQVRMTAMMLIANKVKPKVADRDIGGPFLPAAGGEQLILTIQSVGRCRRVMNL